MTPIAADLGFVEWKFTVCHSDTSTDWTVHANLMIPGRCWTFLFAYLTNIKISSDPAQPLPYRFVGLEFTIFRPCHTCITWEEGNHELRFELNDPQLVCSSVVTVFYALIGKGAAWIRHLALLHLAWGRPTANQNAKTERQETPLSSFCGKWRVWWRSWWNLRGNWLTMCFMRLESRKQVRSSTL